MNCFDAKFQAYIDAYGSQNMLGAKLAEADN